MTHSFTEYLAKENREATSPTWVTIYRQFFPSFETSAVAPRGSDLQRCGVDRTLTLSSGKTVMIQEKTRSKDYGDLLIEFGHTHGGCGWIDTCAADYLCYLSRDTGVARLWNMSTLRRAWLMNRHRWIAAHRIVTAENESYTSLSVAVPLSELPPAHTARVGSVSDN